MEFPDDEDGDGRSGSDSGAVGKERGGLPWYWTAVALVCLIVAVLYATQTL
jgi:hypothetical protein